ncbi:alpha/beta fold hydrolase [Streptomyces sp. NPDC086554]|uniref:type I polyketide synthase n=1 Tax=Streptomyces sp. NPDC086554 TaxID=3154864 RepID=UPI00341203BD
MGSAGIGDNDRLRTVLDVVLKETADLLGQSPDVIDPQRAYLDYGYNSLAALELTSQLGRAFGLELPMTMLFDHPNPDAVARYLVSRIEAPADTTAADETAADSAPADDDPIVIVGVACRYPGGVDSPAALWRLVEERRDAISEFPTDRGWPLAELYHPDPDHPGTTYSKSGGFITGATDFDADFFGISPREALAMDPQQRLLLEGAWEVFEDAGIDPAALRSTPTGVFAGVSGVDYSYVARAGGTGLQGYWGIGTLPAVASGRVAYTFGFEGPALTVDTACSSSLVATHLAMQSLRRGESSLAVAAGVTVLATPEVFVEFSRQRALSPGGRCRSFASAADGTGWAEGMGVLLLERLSDARRNGRRVYGVLRGSAVNQDGASNGMTAPNGPSQERVIRAALADAGLSSADVDAVEGHGTATVLGDPIEAQALLATYGQDRVAGRPLWLGSLKSNIGHTQAAAGVGGVIKMVMAMGAQSLPATLHVDEPTSKVDWSSGAVELLREAREWPRDGSRPRRAGVSSFGASGTNAHVIVEEPPLESPVEAAASEDGPGGPAVWVLSGKMPSGLSAQARRLREWLGARPELDPLDIGYSLATGRAQLSHRAVIVGNDRTELLAGLDQIAEGDPGPRVRLSSRARTGSIAFVVPAPDRQSMHLAHELLAGAPVFAARMGECADALAPHVEWNLLDVLNGAPGAPAVFDEGVFGPAFFAVQVSLAALWDSYGVKADGVVAQPGGELAASVITGHRTLEEAARIVAGASTADTSAAPARQDGAPETGTLRDGIREKAEHDFRAFIEISPQPTLADEVATAIGAAGGDPAEFLITRPVDDETDGLAAFLLMLAQAHVGGVRVDWAPAFADRAARTVELPTYPFQRQRYWLGEKPEKQAAAAAPAQPAAGEERRSGTFTVMLRRAHVENAIGEAVPVLAAASRFRPSFSSTAELSGSPRSVLAADGSASPAVICVPSFLAGSGPHQFARLAVEFSPRMRTSALVLPGFGKSSPLPVSWDLVVEAMAEATLEAAAGERFFLVGHSVGGLMAQAIAERLQRTGREAEGVVMIDTYDIDDRGEREALFDWAMNEILDRDPTGIVVNDDNLLAMGAYLRLYDQWSPISIKAPTLAVRAAGAGATLNAPIDPTWKAADFGESVLADHFSILEDKAATTARVLGEWFARTSHS